MSEKHPPVPPNCPFFQDGRMVFPSSDLYPLMRPAWRLSAPDTMRPIIAAVARCAWLDEIERLRPAMNGESRTMAAFKGITASGKLMVKAGQNASAWAKWARGEAWE